MSSLMDALVQRAIAELPERHRQAIALITAHARDGDGEKLLISIDSEQETTTRPEQTPAPRCTRRYPNGHMVSAEDHARICSMSREGKRPDEIVALTGWSIATVRRCLLGEGILPRGERISWVRRNPEAQP